MNTEVEKSNLKQTLDTHNQSLYVSVMQSLMTRWSYDAKSASAIANKIVSNRKINLNTSTWNDVVLYNGISESFVGEGMLKSVDQIIKMANDAVSEKNKFFNKVVSKKTDKKVK